ncbi:hypothetical protein MMC07_000235 [Pseudocyphellaria aurata]|nr:hypothetical protein [Pseudocyphellaria aurata]
MNTAPFRLTFGVELEFLVRFDPEKCGDVWPGEFVRRRIIQILKANGFSAHNYTYTNVLQWTVTTDGTISDEGCKNCYAIELVSPALDYSPSALKQVMDVVELLVSKLDCFVNETCGLHVHVGNETRGFTLRTLKTFASLITAFEKQLNLLHPLDRHQNGFAKTVYCAFRKDAPPKEKMLIIDELETVDDLIRRFHPVYDASSTEFEFDVSGRDGSSDRYMAFNFFNLKGDDPINTIEFRQHQGTLDPNEIANWVRLACNLVHMSYADEEGVRDLINQHLHDINYTVMDLLVDLKLPDLESFYAPLVSRHEKDLRSHHGRVKQETGFSAAFQTTTLRALKWLTDLRR